MKRILSTASIRLNEDEPTRVPFLNRRHTDGQPLTEKDLKSYDARTVFFDVWQDQHGLNAIGPPLLNLEHELGRMSIEIDGHLLRWRSSSALPFRFNGVSVELPAKSGNVDSVTFKWASGITKTVIPSRWNVFEENTPTLMCIQKNNQSHWIRDWAKYYRITHGIEKVVIYDNGSDNHDELISIQDDSLTFIDWPFPYGPVNSHKNKFSQVGAINHFRMTSGRHTRVFCFDIDELLVLRDPNLLTKMNHLDVLYFNQYRVPHKDGLRQNYSFGDYYQRARSSKNTSKKMIYNAKRFRATTVHYAFCYRSPALNKILLKMRKAENLLTNRYARRYHVSISRLFNVLFNLINMFRGRERSIPLKKGYFLHYSGITTGWKTYMNRLSGSSAEDLVEDDAMKEIRRVLGSKER